MAFSMDFSRYSHRAHRYTTSISVARQMGGPTLVSTAYETVSTIVAMPATNSPNRRRRRVQNVTIARMLTFIPETTNTW